MNRSVRKAIGLVGVLLVVATVSQAADADKVFANAEGRKRAAENGLKEIKTKSPQHSEQVRTAYTDAAMQQNAWLDALCQAVEQGTAAAPDLSSVAAAAASSLVDWVNVRNRALGLPELTGALGDNTRKSVAQDLLDITRTTWRSNRSADAKKRSSTANSLKERLGWRTFEEI
jgi:hypothetical protein